MYWNVRLESICGSGPESGGVVSAPDEAADSGAGARTAAFSAGVDDVPLLQATLLSTNISRGRRKLNHGRHRGTPGKAVRRLVAVPDVLSGPMVSRWSFVLPRDLGAFLVQALLTLRGMYQPRDGDA